MDVEAQRKQYIDALADQAARLSKATVPSSVLEYASSDDGDDETLFAMIADLSLDEDSYDQSIGVLLGILANPSLKAVARLAALRQLGAAEFQPVKFAPFHAEFIALLRGLAIADDKQNQDCCLGQADADQRYRGADAAPRGSGKLAKATRPTGKSHSVSRQRRSWNCGSAFSEACSERQEGYSRAGPQGTRH
jgi:hypothetical protein